MASYSHNSDELQNVPAIELSLHLQGSVVWAPFGATCWPAKLVHHRSTVNPSEQSLQQHQLTSGQAHAAEQGSSQTALVELFGTGLRVDVPAHGLTAWDSDCAGKCTLLHSDMGRQVRCLPCTVIYTTLFVEYCTQEPIFLDASIEAAHVSMFLHA